MIFSDGTIKKLIDEQRIKLIPGDYEKLEDIIDNIACASFDLRLGNYLKLYPYDDNNPINPFEKRSLNPFEETQNFEIETLKINDGEDFILKPGQFILGATKERIGLPSDIVARVEGRSSIARLGILVHITGGFIDPGFGWDGPSTITLEIKNVNTVPVILRAGMRICQIAFEPMNAPADTPYNKKKSAKYNGQILPEQSRFHISG